MTTIQHINLSMVNAYLVQSGGQFILIDSGIPPLWKRLQQALQQAGCTPHNLGLVIFTHADMDHTGNALHLRETYGAKLAIHTADTPAIRDGLSVKRTGISTADKLMLFFANRMGGNAQRISPDILLEDGQRLDAYGLPAVVLHTPGHTPGSIAILTDDGQLIAGDTVGNRRQPALTGLVENLPRMLASLEILKQTHAKTVYPGHGKPFSFEELLRIDPPNVS